MFGFLLVVLFLALAIGWSMHQWRAPYVTAEVSLVIEPNQSARTILRNLADGGVVPNPSMIALPMLLDGRAHRLKAGEYLFTVGMSPEQVIDKIARGQVVIHKFTIPEGWNSRQVRALLIDEPLLTGELPADIPEGSMFPDTILFQRGQSRASVLDIMQRRMREVVATAWANRDAAVPLTSPEQALILASMIEKETGVQDERAMIAGVFYHRLRVGMRLQSDPTVVYGIEVAQRAPLERPLSSADLQADTPYNTYTRDGLPPTPICNPGLAAIHAALHPTSTKALYFVADGQGGHHFSATLAEHNARVAEYRRSLKEAGSEGALRTIAN